MEGINVCVVFGQVNNVCVMWLVMTFSSQESRKRCDLVVG